jgi:hypothetical protein
MSNVCGRTRRDVGEIAPLGDLVARVEQVVPTLRVSIHGRDPPA